ncbi:glycosyltransferase family 2 protein [Candidatus Thiodictyon syntrophicum]|uniref:glycosyltransferase family 2 protein n=1 Tax=Candidatus Thiodictyon syntrophicum TaxID=1166950 RepID=UPI0012FD2896|nr:glycosyltransferase [Candidatus Thiodictyon syntrophicum]
MSLNGDGVPLVSVAIPTYRGAAHLAAAIDSVLAQSLADFELIVIDDHSPDETAQVLAGYSDPRLICLRNPVNLGPAGNWNRCLNEARGQYFKLLPHDDVLAPQCLERQVAVLEADPDERLALAFSARDVLGPDGRRLTRRGYPGGREGRIAAAAVMSSCIRRGTNLLGEPGAVLMRRALTARIGAFDATYPYVIDLDYWFRLLAHGDAWYCPQPLAGFRVSAQQWSVAIGRSQSKEFLAFISRVGPRLSSAPGFADRMAAHVMASLNNLLRLAFYRLYLR